MLKKICATVCAVACTICFYGQDSIAPKKESEVMVTAFRFPNSVTKVPFTLTQIKNTGWNMQAPSMAEVLLNSGAVNVQKSQGGGGSPMIRGFEASRVLLMVDGVRMNNAIYRAGHLQNVITVDANALQQVDVLYGPSSTQYGSDALGGVIHMQTKKPMLSTTQKTELHGTINGRYSSALQENQQHVDVNIGGTKWAALTSFTYSNFGDVVQGDKRDSKYPDFGKRAFYVNTFGGNDYMITNAKFNKQVGSGYKQTDLMQKVLYKPNAKQEHILNVQYSNSTDVPRYDRLTEMAGTLPRFAEWYYGPQKRFMAAYHYNQSFTGKAISKLQSTVAYQAIEESRYDRRFNNKNKNNRIENVDLVSVNVDALIPTKKGEAHTGIDMQFNKLHSEAYSLHIVTGVKQYNISNRYPDGKNRMNVMAAYFQQIQNVNDRTTVNYGIRATTTSLSASIVNNSVMKFPFTSIEQKNSALVGNIGITHRVNNQWKLAAVFSNGFRTPNFDELKVFDSRTGFLIVPNANIKPEYSYNAEVNATKYVGAFQTNVAVFYTLLRNAIQVGNTTFNGNPTVTYLGSTAQVQSALNTGKAFIYGTSASAKYSVEKTTVEATYTYTYGRIDSVGTKRPLDHISPAYGKLSVQHQIGKFNLQIYSLFNSAKKMKDYSSSGEDNQQYATVDGMPSWFTLNFHSQINLQPKLKVLFGVENILDKNYRVFASGISAPGRNFIISLHASF